MKSTLVIIVAVICGIHFVLTGCEDKLLAVEEPVATSGVDSKRTESRPIGGLTDHPNDERVIYPSIVHHTYIPEYQLWANMKCKAWRIEWPEYDAATDSDVIPTVFSLENGALNSFYFLNKTSPAATHQSHFSLFYDERLESSATMWMQLNNVNGAAHLMEVVYFAKADFSPGIIEHMVKERPALFETEWQVGTTTTKINYQAGDFFLFRMASQNLYGGVRIISIAPRTIEVYLAVQNI